MPSSSTSMLYVGDPEIAFGIAEYIDIAVAAILLAYATIAKSFTSSARSRRSRALCRG